MGKPRKVVLTPEALEQLKNLNLSDAELAGLLGALKEVALDPTKGEPLKEGDLTPEQLESMRRADGQAPAIELELDFDEHEERN